jgi:hypothetical protein
MISTTNIKYPTLYKGGYSHTMRNGSDVYHASTYDTEEVAEFIKQVKLLEQQRDGMVEVIMKSIPLLQRGLSHEFHHPDRFNAVIQEMKDIIVASPTLKL